MRQTRDQILAILVVAVGYVVAVLGGVDMQTTASSFNRRLQHLQPGIRYRERCVSANMRLHQVRLLTGFFGDVDQLGKGNILLHASTQFALPAVAIGGFKTGHAA
ncbi:hypothetical protein D3C75_938880 [compost metagenome]